MKRNNFRWAVSTALVVFLGLVLYSNTYHNEFVFDDFANLHSNPERQMIQITPASLFNAAFGGKRDALRPIANLSLAFNYYFDHFNPAGYHIFNTAIHILTAAVLFWLIYLTLTVPAFKGKYNQIAFPTSLFTALLFVSHPVHTQSVTYIVQRMTCMAALFYLCSLLFYNLGRISRGMGRIISFSGAGLSTLMAIGSKETSLTIPVVLLLYEYFFFQGSKIWKMKKYFTVVLVIFTPVFLLLTSIFGHSVMDSIFALTVDKDFTVWQRFLSSGRVLHYYLSLLLLPLQSRLNLDHDFHASQAFFLPSTTWISWVSLLLFIYWGVCLRSKNPFLSFCILWYPINLAMESTFIPLALVFEHRLYLPSVGIIAGGVFILFTVFERFQKRLFILLWALVLLFSINTYIRNKDWTSSMTIWKDATVKSPDMSRPHINLAVAYKLQEKYEDALKEYHKAMEIDPNEKKAVWGIGHVYLLQKNYQKAEEIFNTLLNEGKDSAAAYTNIGFIEKERGHEAQAITLFQKALQLDPEYANAYTSLADLYMEKNRLEDAFILYKKALLLSPHDAHLKSNIGSIYFKKGFLDEAAKEFKEALHIQPDCDSCKNNLGLVYMKQGHYQDALQQFLQVQKENPENMDALYNLSCLHAILNEKSSALGYLKKVIEFGGDHYREMAGQDEDLNNLRNNHEFRLLIYPDEMKGH